MLSYNLILYKYLLKHAVVIFPALNADTVRNQYNPAYVHKQVNLLGFTAG